jgi:hypothetical protein
LLLPLLLLLLLLLLLQDVCLSIWTEDHSHDLMWKGKADSTSSKGGLPAAQGRASTH